MEHLVDDLRQLARQQLARERSGHTLQPTALVNEVYLRLLAGQKLRWESRAHFFGACGRIMRRLLVDHARERKALKRGGGRTMVSLDAMGEDSVPSKAMSLDLIVLDEALTQLGELDQRQAGIAELRLFASLTFQEIAACLGFTDRTIKTEWKKARIWLAHQLT